MLIGTYLVKNPKVNAWMDYYIFNFLDMATCFYKYMKDILRRGFPNVLSLFKSKNDLVENFKAMTKAM